MHTSHRKEYKRTVGGRIKECILHTAKNTKERWEAGSKNAYFTQERIQKYGGRQDQRMHTSHSKEYKSTVGGRIKECILHTAKNTHFSLGDDGASSLKMCTVSVLLEHARKAESTLNASE